MIWIISFFFSLLDAKIDQWLEDRWGIVHWLNVVYRIAFGAVLLWFFPMSWFERIMFAVGAFAQWWLVFNIALNFLRGRAWDYVGKGKGSAFLDRLENNYREPVMFSKILLSIFCPIIFYNHPGFA